MKISQALFGAAALLCGAHVQGRDAQDYARALETVRAVAQAMEKAEADAEKEAGGDDDPA